MCVAGRFWWKPPTVCLYFQSCNFSLTALISADIFQILAFVGNIKLDPTHRCASVLRCENTDRRWQTANNIRSSLFKQKKLLC